MTNETRERIKYYKELLPHAKEKVSAALMMLVIAACVTVTATYAWTTLSTAPEVTGVDTTVTANGSLEIALAHGKGEIPAQSAEGDSSATEGQLIKDANITWGNLINLSETASSSYGLSQITLRPAALIGPTGLLRNPLYGVEYGEDGRISNRVSNDDFAYVYYDEEHGKFLSDLNGDHLGVRAISTVQYENISGNETLIALDGAISSAISGARENYDAMTTDSNNLSAITGLIEAYANNILEGLPQNSLKVTASVPAFYDMMVSYKNDVMDVVGESYVYMINLMDLLAGDQQGNTGYTVDSLMTAAVNGTIPEYKNENGDVIELSELVEFAKDYNELKEYLTEGEGTLSYYAKGVRAGTIAEVTWDKIADEIDFLCEIEKASISNGSTKVILGEAQGVSDLSGVAASALLGRVLDARLEDGALARIETLIGGCMTPKITIPVDASKLNLGINKTINMSAYLRTSNYNSGQPKETKIEGDYEKAKTINTSGNFRGDTATAKDTYALALDFWVRTNAGGTGEATIETKEETIEGVNIVTTVTKTPEQAYLILEGQIKRDGVEERQLTIKDANGNEQPAYIATIKDTNGEPNEIQVFQRYGEYYYIDDNGIEYLFEETILEQYGTLPEIIYEPLTDTVAVISGYEGVNRVWDSAKMDVYKGNTTQGSGSCYVFYAETLSEQKRFLNLLDAMKVVFIDARGRQIGMANMDTENYYAETGKVTVPLVLDKSMAYDLGDDTYGLIPLVKNAATRITAIIYLDGKKLTNDMVLASNEIQGSLNIQFGSSIALLKTTTVTEDGVVKDTKEEYEAGSDLEAIEDEKVMSQVIKVSAEVSETEFVYDPKSKASTKLSVTVEGEGVSPKNVSASFVREVSSTQGVVQQEVFLSREGTTWTNSYVFDGAGKYILRTVKVDGMEYILEKPIEVQVTGTSITSLSCDELNGKNSGTFMTDENSITATIRLGLSSDDIVKSVTSVFTDENGRAVKAKLSLVAGKWVGDVTFTSSGSYKMEYVEIEYKVEGTEKSEKKSEGLDADLQLTIEVLLALQVSIKVTADAATLESLNGIPTNFVLDPPNQPVTLQVIANVFDNNGKQIEGLSNTTLYYGRSGSEYLSDGLHDSLKWNVNEKSYEGQFRVEKPGTYQFSKLTIGSGTDPMAIEKASSTPSIRVKPAGDVEYAENYTDEEQYAPKSGGVAMTIGLANSSVAQDVTATFYHQETNKTVDVVAEDEPVTYGTETRWKFVLDSSKGVDLDGTWQMKDVTMSGVYYNKAYVDENLGETVTIDLSNYGITTRVVNELEVVLGVGDLTIGDNEETYFMDVPSVTDVTVTFKDWKGNDINDLIERGDIDIKELNVYYYRNPEESSLGEYFSTTDDISEITPVSGDISDTNEMLEDETRYEIAPLNFQYAGIYDSCKVKFVINNKDVELTSEKENIKDDTGTFKLLYTEKNVMKGDTPKYTIIWKNRPTVQLTGTTPVGTTAKDSRETDSTGAEEFDINLASGCDAANLVKVKNYYDAYNAVVYFKYTDGAYTAPKVSLQLLNVGRANSATVVINDEYDNVATFKNGIAECEVGSVPRNGDPNYIDPVILDELTLTYDDKTFVAKLPTSLTIKQPKEALTKVSFVITDNYKELFTLPDDIINYDKNAVTFTLPMLSNTQNEWVAIGNKDEIIRETIVTSTYEWTEGDGCDVKDMKVTETKTTRDVYDYGELKEVSKTYTVKKWDVSQNSDGNSVEYDSGKEISIIGNCTVTAQVTNTSVDTGITKPADYALNIDKCYVETTYSEDVEIPTNATKTEGQPQVKFYNSDGQEIDKPAGIE